MKSRKSLNFKGIVGELTLPQPLPPISPYFSLINQRVIPKRGKLRVRREVECRRQIAVTLYTPIHTM